MDCADLGSRRANFLPGVFFTASFCGNEEYLSRDRDPHQQRELHKVGFEDTKGRPKT